MKRATVTTPEGMTDPGYWFWRELATHFPLPDRTEPIIEIEAGSGTKEPEQKWDLYLTPSTSKQRPQFWIKHPIPSLAGERDRYESISQTVAETWLLKHYGAITPEDIERLIDIYTPTKEEKEALCNPHPPGVGY